MHLLKRGDAPPRTFNNFSKVSLLFTYYVQYLQSYLLRNLKIAEERPRTAAEFFLKENAKTNLLVFDTVH